MRPRLLGRGNARHHGQRHLERQGFNEAAAVGPRKLKSSIHSSKA